jgi:hypothetical protein
MSMATTVTVTVQHGRRCFSFQLGRRELDLGKAGEAPYYWMDSRQFRQEKPGPNLRACIDLWWTAVEQAGAARERDNEVNLVLAECYPLVNTARSLQDVYLDAHLHRCADRQFTLVKEAGHRQVLAERTFSLPPAEASRLRALAASRDARRIRSELEGLFLGEMPSLADLPAYQRDARHWIGDGIDALRQGGRHGLGRYVSEVDSRLRKYRKQGHQDRIRGFVNHFAYECKVAFYLCHTSAWVGLVQTLTSDGHLNLTGERFARLWHHQNQPAEESSGLPHAARDVFCGQVLSLHPLSAIVLNDPYSLTRIGSWLAHPDHDRLHATNRVGTCPEYWEMVATILEAAHEYRHGRDRWEATRRRVRSHRAGSIDNAARDDATPSVALFFEEFAAERHLSCPHCGQKLAYAGHVNDADAEDRVVVRFRCSTGHEHSVTIAREDMLPPSAEE